MDKQYPASLIHLHEMLAIIKQKALDFGFDAENLRKIELASEEALVNIIKHGFLNKLGSISISCNAYKGGGIKITIKDNGISFNPLKARERNASRVQEVGGLGITIILKAMDEVEYQRKDNCNCLILIKFKNGF